MERIGAAYLWGLERLDGPAFRKLFDTGTADDFEVLVRVFWMIRNENLADEQRQLILTFWSRTFEWAQHQTQAPARFLSTLSLLATHIRMLGSNERRLLEAVAPHAHAGHEAYEFIAELLKLAAQDPAAITAVLQSMTSAHVPDYDYEDRLRWLLEFLAAHGEPDTVILISNQSSNLPGIVKLFKNLTER